MKLKKTTKQSFITILMVVVLYIAISVAKSGGLLTYSLKGQLVPICVYIVMAVSLNLTVGILGELSLGHAGFMSIGAFTGAVVSMSLTGEIASSLARLVIAIVCGAILAGIFGFIIGLPVLRLKGDYLAIVTLAFGEIIKTIINCVYIGKDSNGLRFSLENAEALGLAEGGKAIIKGPMGAVNISPISTFTVGFVLILITLAIIFTLVDSRAGRAIMAIRDNRIAAESVGIPITKYKMMAFVISAALAGAGGALYALNYSTIVPTQFNYNTSILILVYVVLGGIGNMRGSVISATILVLLPELLRAVEKYRMLVYAVVLIVVMIITNNKKAKLFIANIFAKITSPIRKRIKMKHAHETDEKEEA